MFGLHRTHSFTRVNHKMAHEHSYLIGLSMQDWEYCFL